MNGGKENLKFLPETISYFCGYTTMTQNEVIQHYNTLLSTYRDELKKLRQKRSSLGWLRLGAILAIIIAFYIFWQLGALYVTASALVLIAIFLFLVKRDIKNQKEIRFTSKAIELYEKELSTFDGAYPFANGTRYSNNEHPYAADLDIFGEKSLFQYLNRTNTEPASDRLAAYLSEKASLGQIHDRQEILKELKESLEWLKKFQTTGALNGFSNSSRDKLTRWIAENNVFLPFKPWSWLRYLLPALATGITVLFIFSIIGLGTFLIILLLMSVISWQVNKYVAPIHRQLDDITKELEDLSFQVKMVEKRIFRATPLIKIQQGLIVEDSTASLEISRIKKLLDNLDLRYNIVISFPLNLLLLWDLQQILSLEKWKLKNKTFLNRWIDVIAEIETLGSLATFAFNHPDYVFPEIVQDYFILEGKDIGHPLIPGQKRVNNDASIPSQGKLMLVTGSNMAGKSTYLRSIGVNCVLAFCGAPVCAASFRVSLVSLVSSMRIVDNLQESTSTFYAELKKLKVIIDRVNRHEQVLILLDEILRGTNSLDRHTGSKALIRQLIEQNTAGIIATHDLELANLKENFAGQILNYHFDVQVNNEELYFDYKLKPGICQSMNASILMKKIGIEI